MLTPNTLVSTQQELRSHERTSRLRPRCGGIVAARYRLVECLGEGGMGTVWRARDCVLGGEVAVKLHSGRVDPVAIGALLREANAAVRVRHPSSIRVLALGVADDGTPFIVMDFARGETVAEHLKKHGPMAAEQAVRVLLPLAGALRAAHRCGVIHRDIKPSNIMLLHDGALVLAQLLDFGLAAMDDEAFDDSGEVSRNVVWGTPPYMSPEQVRGESSDARSDIWSFCTVLWEVIAGRRLFPGDDSSCVMDLIADSKRQLKRPREIETSLWSILERGLQADASERWPSFDALGHALATWLARRGCQADASGAWLAAHWGIATEPSRLSWLVTMVKRVALRRKLT